MNSESSLNEELATVALVCHLGALKTLRSHHCKQNYLREMNAFHVLLRRELPDQLLNAQVKDAFASPDVVTFLKNFRFNDNVRNYYNDAGNAATIDDKLK